MVWVVLLLLLLRVMVQCNAKAAEDRDVGGGRHGIRSLEAP